MDSRKNGSGLLGSAVALGLMLFLCFDLTLLALRPLAKVEPECLPSAHTWVWWANREYMERRTAPNVVILGSSLLMNPIAKVDADYLHKDLDYVKHHRSVYLERQLKDRCGREDLSCFNFALPGAMVSDDFMVLRAMSAMKKKPDIIVLGLGVRDFVDSGVNCPAATPPFKYLQRFADIDDIVDLSLPDVWRRAEYWIGKAVYLWEKKLDLQVLLSEAAKTMLGSHFAAYFPACRLTEADPTKNMPGNLRSEIEEGVYVIKADQAYSYEDNTTEYRKRFRNKNERMFDIQCQFLDKFLTEAQKEGIKIVLVNLPVTAANHALMPTGAYDRYAAFLKTEALRWNVPLIDPAQSVDFTVQDYSDTAHMNSVGGRKLLDILVSSLVGDRSTLAVLVKPDKADRGLAIKDGKRLF